MERETIITQASYVLGKEDIGKSSIKAIINGQTMSVPLDTNNRYYAEILKQVDEGIITIAEAD